MSFDSVSSVFLCLERSGILVLGLDWFSGHVGLHGCSLGPSATDETGSVSRGLVGFLSRLH